MEGIQFVTNEKGERSPYRLTCESMETSGKMSMIA